MRWTAWCGLAALVLGLSGCYYGYRSAYLGARYSTSSRPHASYYCYDCHGYRYFDPYYDWCAGYGFRYQWAAHPQVVHLYRQRYVRIREQHPEYGRYRYRPGYKSSTRYRAERDYEAWRSGKPNSEERPPGIERKSRKDSRQDKERKREGSRERKERRDPGERPSRRGGRGA